MQRMLRASRGYQIAIVAILVLAAVVQRSMLSSGVSWWMHRSRWYGLRGLCAFHARWSVLATVSGRHVQGLCPVATCVNLFPYCFTILTINFQFEMKILQDENTCHPNSFIYISIIIKLKLYVCVSSNLARGCVVSLGRTGVGKLRFTPWGESQGERRARRFATMRKSPSWWVGSLLPRFDIPALCLPSSSAGTIWRSKNYIRSVNKKTFNNNNNTVKEYSGTLVA